MKVVLWFLFFTHCLIGLSYSIDTEPLLARADEVTKISFNLSSPKGIGAGILGHASIRVSTGRLLSVNDIVYEFVANERSDKISYLRGIGIGENYPIKLKTYRYKAFAYSKTILENRQLENYELNLTTEQKQNIVLHMNSLVDNHSQRYSFFNENCSTYAVNFINAVFPIPFQINIVEKNIPIAVPNALKKNNLVTETHIENDGITKRYSLIHQFKQHIPGHENIFESISKDILEGEPYIDAMILLRLASIFRSNNYSEKEKRLFSTLGQQLVMESSLSTNKFLPFFDRDEGEIIYFENDYDLGFLGKADKLEIKSVRLDHHQDKVYFQIKIKAYTPHAERGKIKDIKIHAKDLTYRENAYWWNDKRLGFEVDKTFNPEKIANHNLRTLFRISSKHNYKYFRTQFALYSAGEKWDQDTSVSRVSIANGFGGMAMCNPLAILQKYLEERAIFLPEIKKLEQNKYFELLEKLYEDYIIVIPGFSNIEEFTLFLDQKRLAKLIYKKRDTLDSISGLYKTFTRGLNAVELDESSISTLKNLLKLGHKVKLNFNVANPSQDKDVGHTIIVYDMYEDSNYYYLKVYDPNFLAVKTYNISHGLSEKVAHDKALLMTSYKLSKSSFKLQNGTKSSIAYIEQRNQLDDQVYIGLTSSHDPNFAFFRKLLLSSASKGKKYAFRLGDFIF